MRTEQLYARQEHTTDDQGTWSGDGAGQEHREEAVEADKMAGRFSHLESQTPLRRIYEDV